MWNKPDFQKDKAKEKIMNYDVYGKKFADIRQFGLKAPESLIGQIAAKNVAMARIGATITVNNKKLPVMITRVQLTKEVKNEKKDKV